MILTHAWNVHMLGPLWVFQHDAELTRFQTQKSAELLAYLAYFPQVHTRDHLMETLWPEVHPTAGRNRLKQTLASLRRQLEPPHVPANSILLASRMQLQLNPQAVRTDVTKLEASLRQADRSPDPSERRAALAQAVELYRGELLQGMLHEWILPERHRLFTAYTSALRKLAHLCETAQDWESAIVYAQRLVQADGLREDAHQTLIRLYLVAGQQAAALRQYQSLESVLQEHLGMLPAQATRTLVAPLFPAPGRAPGPLPATRRSKSPKTSPLERAPRRLPALDDANPAISPTSLGVGNELPQPLTRFWGREAEVEQLTALMLGDEAVTIGKDAKENTSEALSFGTCRLVTLTGFGGVGKTRLAIAWARHVRPTLESAPVFISCPDAPASPSLWAALYAVLGLPPQETFEADPQTVRTQVQTALHAHPRLLIFDTAEQTGDLARLVLTLLEETPSVQCLITARCPLHIAGERVFPVTPLPLPTSTNSLDDLLPVACVRLFVDRAQAVQPDFQLTSVNAEAIVALCQELEGIPLALELAAAWVKTLSLAQLRHRSSKRFELLVSRKQGGQERHRSLRAAIQGSYDLLSAKLQRFVEQLSLFAGSWTLEAAQAVTGETLALEWLQELQEHAFILNSATSDRPRFDMLSTVRAYVRQRSNGEIQSQFAPRHAYYFLCWAQHVKEQAQGPQQLAWLKQVEQEYANLQAAMQWYDAQPRSDNEILHLVGALWRFWWMRGRFQEGLAWLESALTRAEGASSATRANLLLGAAHLTRFLGQTRRSLDFIEQSIALYREAEMPAQLGEALAFGAANPLLLQTDAPCAWAWLEQSVALCREAKNLRGLAAGLRQQAGWAWVAGQEEKSLLLLSESLRVCRQSGDIQGLCSVLSEAGYFAIWRGDYAYAALCCKEEWELALQLEDPGAISHALWHRGNVARCQGYFDEAIHLLNECLSYRARLSDPSATADVLSSLGVVAAAQGKWEVARSWQEQSLAIRRDLHQRSDIASSLQHLAWIALNEENYASAHELYTEALALFRESRLHLGISACLHGLALWELAADKPVTACALLQESLALRYASREKKGIVECLEALARVCIPLRQYRVAMCILGAVQALRERMQAPRSPVEQRLLAPCLRICHNALSSQEYADAESAGQAMTLLQVISYASTMPD